MEARIKLLSVVERQLRGLQAGKEDLQARLDTVNEEIKDYERQRSRLLKQEKP